MIMVIHSFDEIKYFRIWFFQKYLEDIKFVLVTFM